jgi:hypothetical protein
MHMALPNYRRIKRRQVGSIINQLIVHTDARAALQVQDKIRVPESAALE